jgi:hypothetical protein
MTKKRKTELLNSLTRGMAISILSRLCDGDADVEAAVLKMAEADLQRVDADEIAEAVFRSLNALDVVEIYHNAGATYYGYIEPSEYAYEMVENAIGFFAQDIEKYRKLGMKNAEREAFER